MIDDSYAPWEVVVSPGTTVTWRNVGAKPHDVASVNNEWRPEPVGPGGTWRWTFNAPGTYSIFCTFHPVEMRGDVIVR
jgi:plastocyanin